jgi:hypothetical protein
MLSYLCVQRQNSAAEELLTQLGQVWLAEVNAQGSRLPDLIEVPTAMLAIGTVLNHSNDQARVLALAEAFSAKILENYGAWRGRLASTNIKEVVSGFVARLSTTEGATDFTTRLAANTRKETQQIFAEVAQTLQPGPQKLRLRPADPPLPRSLRLARHHEQEGGGYALPLAQPPARPQIGMGDGDAPQQ